VSAATLERPTTHETPPPPSFSIVSILAPLAAIVLGTFMAILDSTVVNVALPTLGRVFQTDLTLLQWIITGYLLANAAVVPLAGFLSDRFGAKRMYLTALVLFTAGSVLCAFAPNADVLVLYRVLQGLGGGMLMPIGMAFLYRLAPPEKRGAVMGAFGIPILLAPALGPVLSGWLIQYADWRLIFLINLPVGLVALVAGLRALPAMPAQGVVGALDLPGVVLGPLAFAALSYGISESTTYGWGGAPTLGGIVVGVVALALFAARELTARHPLLELRVFRSRDFTLAMLTSWVGFAAMFGTLFLVPLFLQQVRGYGPFATGLITLPQAVTSAVLMPIAGRLFDRFGARPLVVVGLALVAATMWLLTGLTPDTTGTELILPLALWGAGMGCMIMPLNTHLLNAAPRDLVSRVTSLSGATQNVIGSLAIASFATLLQARTAAHLVGAGPSAQAGLGQVQGAMAAGFADVFGSALVLVALAVVLAFTLRRHPSAHSSAVPLPLGEG